VRRLRVQLTVLLALLGLLVLAWGAAVFLGARDAARSSAALQSTVDRVDELRRTATRLSRDLVTMETSRRAYLVTGDGAVRRAHLRAETRATRGVRRVRRLSRPWVELSPLADRVARQDPAWVRTGRAELAVRRQVVERILSPFRAMAARHTIRTSSRPACRWSGAIPTRSSRY